MKIRIMNTNPLPLIQSEVPRLHEWAQLLEVAYDGMQFSNGGALAIQVERALSTHINPNVSGYLCSNATAGLQACLIAFNLQGKNVAVSNFTFPATLHSIISVGAQPFLCDVNRDSCEIDILSLHRLNLAVNMSLSAVIITRVFGTYRDISELISYCHENNIRLIVDAAASFPSNSNYLNVSNYLEVYSFHATKPFAIGEGGFVVGQRDSISSVKKASNFGLSPDGTFEDGLNAKADEFLAARAIARFLTYSESQDSRLSFVKQVYPIFDSVKEISLIPIETPCTWGLLPLRFETENHLLSFKQSIDSKVMSKRYYFPSLKSGYRGKTLLHAPVSLENSEEIANTTLCLPVYHQYSDEVFDLLVNTYRQGISKIKN
jgi:dTDP-4-amino-4,6-dideoxygalactose transaminase